MESNTLAKRLIDRGEQMGLAGELPSLSGLNADRLEAIRRGEVFSSTEFERLCRALAVDPVAMYRGEDLAPNRVPARFRAATSQDRPAPGDIRTLALAAEQGRTLAHLCTMLGRQIHIADFRQVRGIAGAVELWREGYGLGENARHSLSAEPGPLHELEQLLRDLGVHVARVVISSRHVSAASIWEPMAVPVILLNSRCDQNEHPGARRATLAHELCHLLHDASEHDITTRVSWATEKTGNYNDAAETRARAFAPAFLAPRTQVKAWLGEQKKALRDDNTALIQALATDWGLSFEGAVWHAKNCDILDAQEADHLASLSRKPRIDLKSFENSQAGLPPTMFHSSLPERPAPLWDGWASELVLAALEEGHITAGRARELLTWE